MKSFVVLPFIFAFFFFASHPCAAQRQELTRDYPMGERTSAYGRYSYESPNGKVKFEYYLLGPQNAEKGVRYPLIVMLHGHSGHAYGGWVLANQVLKQGMPAFVAVPMMEANVTDWMAEIWTRQDSKHPRPIDHVAILTKNLAADLPVDSARIYVTGYSMGGVGTFGALYFYPDLFAAGIPICGGWYPEDAKNFVNIPLWAFHGSADRSVPVSQTRNIIKAIKSAGGSPRYTEYPGVDHNSWIQAYNEPGLWTWLFSQKKSP